MNDPLEQIGKMLDAEFGPGSCKRLGSGNALAINMATEKYRDPGGNAYCTTLFKPEKGHLLLCCPELLDISDCEYRSELLAACLSLQNLSYLTVQFQLLQDPAGRKLTLATCVKLNLGDKILIQEHLRCCAMELLFMTDHAYEPLLEVKETGHFTLLKQFLPPGAGDFLDLFTRVKL